MIMKRPVGGAVVTVRGCRRDVWPLACRPWARQSTSQSRGLPDRLPFAQSMALTGSLVLWTQPCHRRWARPSASRSGRGHSQWLTAASNHHSAGGGRDRVLFAQGGGPPAQRGRAAQEADAGWVRWGYVCKTLRFCCVGWQQGTEIRAMAQRQQPSEAELCKKPVPGAQSFGSGACLRPAVRQCCTWPCRRFLCHNALAHPLRLQMWRAVWRPGYTPPCSAYSLL